MHQGARLVDEALESGKLFELEGWKHLEPALDRGTLHLIGLLTDGGVHSRYDQLKLLFDGVGRLRAACVAHACPHQDLPSWKGGSATTDHSHECSACMLYELATSMEHAES